MANKRGNYNASAKEMHKRSFWLSHKLNYGNMLLFVLVWRENQTAHTRTQTRTRIRDSLCLIKIKHPLPETQCWGGRHPFRHSRSSHHRLWRENYPQKKLHTSRIISVFTTAISSLWHLLHPQEAYRGSGCHNVPKFPSHWQQIHVVSGSSLFLLILLKSCPQ